MPPSPPVITLGPVIPSALWLFVRVHIRHNEKPLLPPYRYDETYYVIPIARRSINFPPRLLLPNNGNSASLAAPHLHRPYLVSRYIACVDPPVIFVSYRTLIPAVSCCSAHSTASSPPSRPYLMLSDAIRFVHPLSVTSKPHLNQIHS